MKYEAIDKAIHRLALGLLKIRRTCGIYFLSKIFFCYLEILEFSYKFAELININFC